MPFILLESIGTAVVSHIVAEMKSSWRTVFALIRLVMVAAIAIMPPVFLLKTCRQDLELTTFTW